MKNLNLSTEAIWITSEALDYHALKVKGTIIWLPIIQFHENSWHGVDKNFEWISGTYTRASILHPKSRLFTFYCALEFPLNEVLRSITTFVERYNLPVEIINNFPIEKIIVNALDSSIEEIKQAYNWIEDLPKASLSLCLLNALVKINTDTVYPSHIRHRANSLIKRFDI